MCVSKTSLQFVWSLVLSVILIHLNIFHIFLGVKDIARRSFLLFKLLRLCIKGVLSNVTIWSNVRQNMLLYIFMKHFVSWVPYMHCLLWNNACHGYSKTIIKTSLLRHWTIFSLFMYKHLLKQPETYSIFEDNCITELEKINVTCAVWFQSVLGVNNRMKGIWETQ